MSIHKIICWNVNGIRALKGKIEAFKGSLKAYFDSLDAEVFVFQETKVGSQMKDLEEALLHIDGYESFWSLCKRKPGYSGVATFVKKGLTVDARNEFGNVDFDCEGRVMMTDHGAFLLFNVYFPNSGNGDRLGYKMDFYRWFENICDGYLKQGRKIIIAGDVNTTHNEIDIWCTDKLQQGLFAEERKWMDHFFQKTDTEPFVDMFRSLNPTAKKYSWWDVKTNMRITDQGYRLDYFLLNQSFAKETLECDMMTDQLGSDHCPIFITLQPQAVPTPSKIPLLSSEKIKARQPKISNFFKPKSQTNAASSSSCSISAEKKEATSTESSDTHRTKPSSVAENQPSNQSSTDDLPPPIPKDKREREDHNEEPEPKRPKVSES